MTSYCDFKRAFISAIITIAVFVLSIGTCVPSFAADSIYLDEKAWNSRQDKIEVNVDAKSVFGELKGTAYYFVENNCVYTMFKVREDNINSNSDVSVLYFVDTDDATHAFSIRDDGFYSNDDIESLYKNSHKYVTNADKYKGVYISIVEFKNSKDVRNISISFMVKGRYIIDGMTAISLKADDTTTTTKKNSPTESSASRNENASSSSSHNEDTGSSASTEKSTKYNGTMPIPKTTKPSTKSNNSKNKKQSLNTTKFKGEETTLQNMIETLPEPVEDNEDSVVFYKSPDDTIREYKRRNVPLLISAVALVSVGSAVVAFGIVHNSKAKKKAESEEEKIEDVDE